MALALIGYTTLLGLGVTSPVGWLGAWVLSGLLTITQKVQPKLLTSASHHFHHIKKHNSVAREPKTKQQKKRWMKTKTSNLLFAAHFPVSPIWAPASLQRQHQHHPSRPYHLTVAPAALALIPAQTRLLPIESAGHDLRGGRFDFETVVTEFLKI